MTREELVSNLGTIARSGSKAFMETIKDEGKVSYSVLSVFLFGLYVLFVLSVCPV